MVGFGWYRLVKRKAGTFSAAFLGFLALLLIVFIADDLAGYFMPGADTGTDQMIAVYVTGLILSVVVLGCVAMNGRAFNKAKRQHGERYNG